MSHDANKIINKGPVLYYGSNGDNSTEVSLSDILFSFMLEKYIVCNVCGLRSLSFESSSVYIYDSLSVPLWVYMRFPVPEHQH